MKYNNKAHTFMLRIKINIMNASKLKLLLDTNNIIRVD